MSKPRILYCDRTGFFLEHMSKYFEYHGLKVDTANYVDNAMVLFSQNRYAAILTDLAVPCSDKTRARYKEKADWSHLFTNPRGGFDLNLFPGGAIFLLHLHSEAYAGLKILASGVGRSKDIIALEDQNYIDHYYGKNQGVAYNLLKLIESKGIRGNIPATKP